MNIEVSSVGDRAPIEAGNIVARNLSATVQLDTDGGRQSGTLGVVVFDQRIHAMRLYKRVGDVVDRGGAVLRPVAADHHVRRIGRVSGADLDIHAPGPGEVVLRNGYVAPGRRGIFEVEVDGLSTVVEVCV